METVPTKIHVGARDGAGNVSQPSNLVTITVKLGMKRSFLGGWRLCWSALVGSGGLSEMSRRTWILGSFVPGRLQCIGSAARTN
jgi:hypothetical protein